MPTPPLGRVPSRSPWALAALAALFLAASLAPGAQGVDLPAGPPGGGKVVTPESGTWVGTFEEQTGGQLVKQNRVFDLEDLIDRKLDVDHNYTAWQEPFPGWR